MTKILIAKGCSKPRDGSVSAKQYPYWDELVSLLTDFEVIEVNGGHNWSQKIEKTMNDLLV